MTGADDPELDALSESVAGREPVDWNAGASRSGDPLKQERRRALRDLERVLQYHHELHRSWSPSGHPTAPELGAAPSSKTWGHLTILELVSAGANGEVWRAWDSWLERDVALKFLQSNPTDLGGPTLLDEARALARVRHPGVVAVHGIAEHDGRIGMWMEFLVGSTLSAEIERRGALPPAEVARLGLALCHALEAIEAAGVVHRDLKPANIVLESSGRVVLTDFGLGRRWEFDDPDSWRASGTPIFMSPGQHAGEPATPKSDLYALGVTLRWALSGRSPFDARNFDELKREAARGPSRPLAVECPSAPPALVAAIESAMSPSAGDRIANAAELARSLEAVVAPAEDRKRFPSNVVAIASAVVVLALAAAWWLPRGRTVPPSLPARFTISAPAGTLLLCDPGASSVSPDGRQVVFLAQDSSGTKRLWLRPLDSDEARPLPGTERAEVTFWSPDSRHLGFFADGKLRKLSIAGGLPEILCDAHDERGGSWGRNGVIVFAPVPAGPLCRISAEGGEVTEILRPDSALHETALRWPEFLPDGDHFLFVSLPGHDGKFDVSVGSLSSKTRRPVMTSGAAPIRAGDHDLIVVENERLMDQPFDFQGMKPAGRAVALGPTSSIDVSVGQRLAAASFNGVLVQPSAGRPNTDLLWLDRAGKTVGKVSAPEGRYEKLFFSPDGARLLAARRSSAAAVDLWSLDIARSQASRFSQGSQTRIGGRPVWSPDGRWVAFSSNREGPTNIYRRSTIGTADEELLYQSRSMFKEVDSWSPDGKYLVFEQADPVTEWDLWILPLDGRPPIPYANSKFTEVAAQISPDGHWLSYASDATGRLEVYVRSFPTPGPEYRITRDGGLIGYWSASGKELLVVNPEINTLVWSVPVSTSPEFRAGEPRALFRSRLDALWVVPTPRGDRFLESVPAADALPPGIDVITNWPSLVKK